jgi:uncharacterized membrane-anchored protein
MKKWILIVIALQVIALAFIAGKREWIYHFGEVVYLKTAPVDPRDIFRGDFVRLNYDIAAQDSDISQPSSDTLHKDQTLFMLLYKDKRDIAYASAITTDKPSDGLFIKGFHSRYRNIRFGIEKYFIEQGSGKSIEDKRGSRNSWQTSMEVEVALGSDGTAVIKGYRWSNISIELTALAVSEENSNDELSAETDRVNPKIRVRFKNTGTEDIILLDNDQHCSFTLFNLNTNKNMAWANKNCSTASINNKKIKNNGLDNIVLKTEDIYQFDIDFDKKQWQVLNPKDTSEAVTLIDLERSWNGFRLIYQAPVGEVEKDDTVYASSLKTAQFTIAGRVD